MRVILRRWFVKDGIVAFDLGRNGMIVNLEECQEGLGVRMYASDRV